jgi:hypothetical protein
MQSTNVVANPGAGQHIGLNADPKGVFQLKLLNGKPSLITTSSILSTFAGKAAWEPAIGWARHSSRANIPSCSISNTTALAPLRTRWMLLSAPLAGETQMCQFYDYLPSRVSLYWFGFDYAYHRCRGRNRTELKTCLL